MFPEKQAIRGLFRSISFAHLLWETHMHLLSEQDMLMTGNTANLQQWGKYLMKRGCVVFGSSGKEEAHMVHLSGSRQLAIELPRSCGCAILGIKRCTNLAVALLVHAK